MTNEEFALRDKLIKVMGQNDTVDAILKYEAESDLQLTFIARAACVDLLARKLRAVTGRDYYNVLSVDVNVPEGIVVGLLSESNGNKWRVVPLAGVCTNVN